MVLSSQQLLWDWNFIKANMQSSLQSQLLEWITDQESLGKTLRPYLKNN
jgi:hypothetical protein